MSTQTFNMIAELVLDGRLDGVVGNTISQNCFGNNIGTTIGKGVEFNIDWLGYYLKRDEGHSSLVAALFSKLFKTVDYSNGNNGFFDYTVGNSVSLSSNGKMWDLSRAVDKTEFGEDPNPQDDGADLKPLINYIFAFNLCTCVALQTMTLFSAVVSETTSDSKSAQNSQAIINALEILIYLLVPGINTFLANAIMGIEVKYAGLNYGRDEGNQTKAKIAKLEQESQNQEKINKTINEKFEMIQSNLQGQASANLDNSLNWDNLTRCIQQYENAYLEYKKNNWFFRQGQKISGKKPNISDFLINVNSSLVTPSTR